MNYQRLQSNIGTLVERWLDHCHENGNKAHIPVTNGGKATYVYNPATMRIACGVYGCKWDYRIPESEQS